MVSHGDQYTSVIYMLHLGHIFKKYNVKYHCYADNMQIYLLVTVSDASQQLQTYLSKVHHWMCDDFLHLNAIKTKMLVVPARFT